jgi:uncharacterized protein with GYD domain
MKINTKYGHGDFVVIKHDPDKAKRMITAVTVSMSGVPRYCTQYGVTEYWAYEKEIDENGTEEKKVGFAK